MLYKFENPLALWLLLLVIPLLIVLFIINKLWVKKSLNHLGNGLVLRKIIPHLSTIKTNLKFWIKGLAIIFLLLGLANLQYGTKIQEVEKKGLDIMIALDVSNSMLAEDLKPNRLTKAKRAIFQLIKNLRNDRLGIIIFAGEAFVQLPITSDYSAAKLFLSEISTEAIATQGTDISKAIYLSARSFNPQSKTNKAIIIITDGENHEENIEESINAVKEKGISVHAIGMGSEQGVPIPNYSNGKRTNGFKTDNKGNTIISKININMLKSIASTGDGVFVKATNSNVGLKDILSHLNKIERKKYGSKTFQSQDDHFQIFIFLAILMIIIDVLLSSRKNTLFNKLKLFND